MSPSLLSGKKIYIFVSEFHKNFKSFATDASATPTQKEQAAKDAGFKERADLSFYLRSLLNGHHDTFATNVD